jgi:hypothetical protein
MDFAHCNLPCPTATCGVQTSLWGAIMPDRSFGRCDGHHELFDFWKNAAGT